MIKFFYLKSKGHIAKDPQSIFQTLYFKCQNGHDSDIMEKEKIRWTLENGSVEIDTRELGTQFLLCLHERI